MPEYTVAEIGQMILNFFRSTDAQEQFASGSTPKMPAELAGCTGYQIDQGVKYLAESQPVSQIGAVSVSANAPGGFTFTGGKRFGPPPGADAPPERVLAYHTSVHNATVINDNDTLNIDQSRTLDQSLTQIASGRGVNIADQRNAGNLGDEGVAVGAGAQTGPVVTGAGGGGGPGGGPVTVVDGGPGADDIQIAGAGSGPQVQDATLIGSAVGTGAASGGIGGQAVGGGTGGGSGGTIAEPGSTVNQGGGTTAGGIASTAGGSGTTAGGIGGTAGDDGAIVAGAGSGGIGEGVTVGAGVEIAAAGGNLNQQTAGAGIDQSADVTLAGRDAVDIDAAINEPPVELASVADPEPLATEAPLDGAQDPDVESDPLA